MLQSGKCQSERFVAHESEANNRFATVNSSMSKWIAAMSDIPQGPVVEPMLFNTFISDTDIVIECTLSKFADGTKLCGAVNTLEGQDAVQTDLDRLETSVRANLMEFNKSKYKVLYLGWGKPKHKYRPGAEWIKGSPAEEDLGVLVDGRLDRGGPQKYSGAWNTSPMRKG